MATTTPETADQVVSTLDHALKRAGLRTDIMEPSTRLKVFSPSGNASMDETITLRPNDENELTWYWSWHTEERPAVIGPASDVTNTVLKLKRVVSARVM